MAFLIDSNIIIYSYSDEYQYLREIILDDSVYISEISRIEVLGYHKLKPDEERYFIDVFDVVPAITPSRAIFGKAIQVRKQYNLKLGDSLIAATALVHNLVLCTRNTGDFEKIKELKCMNPVRAK